MKKEFILGTSSIVIFVLLIVFSVFQYNQQKRSPSSSTGTQQVASVILTKPEILKHATPSDCWIIIESKVYNVTDYLRLHPGGASIIVPYCGTDAATAFATQGGKGSHSSVATQELSLLYIGDVNGMVKQQVDQNALKQLPVGRNEDDD